MDSPAALRFFRLHGELDVHHARGLLESIERCLAHGGSLEAAKAISAGIDGFRNCAASPRLTGSTARLYGPAP